jgi:hypothetical protein
MTTVIAIPATRPASNPAASAFDLLIALSILIGLKRDAQERGDDPRTRDECPAQCARNF